MRVYLCCLYITVFSILFSSFYANAQQPGNPKEYWVDSVYNKLTTEERIGQLFMVAAYSGGRDYNDDKITNLISNHQVGGLIFMQGNAISQALLTNKYQAMAQVPLLIAMDAEWGLGMRLDSIRNLPKQMMIGATNDSNFARRVGAAISYQCKRLGVHIDFAPVIDVNNNPANPVINFRSYGEDKTRVAHMGIAYMHGLQNNGIIACAKHFPGHGDTNVDSHLDLPTINKSLAQLDTLELYPFRELIYAGVKSIMVAHLAIPALEVEPHTPTTLSKNTVTNLLKEKMHFNGLVFTDALNMKGVTKYFQPGEVDLRAFLAGNDVLLFPEDVATGIKKIKEALDSGLIKQADLELSVKKILAAKYDAGLAHFKPISTQNITNDIDSVVDDLREQTAKAAITLVKDDNGVINRINRNMRVGYVGVNADTNTYLRQYLRDSLAINLTTYWLPKGKPVDTSIFDKLKDYDAVVVAVHKAHQYPGSSGYYGLSEDQINFLKSAGQKDNTILTLMCNPYLLQNFCDVHSAIVAYEDDTITERVAANLLLKKFRAKGILPVTPCVVPAAVTAVQPPQKVSPVTLKKTDFPADAGVVNIDALYKLNLFIERSIVDHVFPGCRIVASKNGIVFYDKSFGYLTYEKTSPVDTNTIYDVASLSKVLATDLAVMHLYETGKLKLDKTIGDYLPWTKGTDKADLHIRDLLLHQAGLKSWIPFYKETLDANGNPKYELYRNFESKDFNIPVAKSLYLRSDYPDTIWNEILASPLENKGRYVYSDLDYYFLAAIVQQITGKRIDKYAEEQFYKPMGLKHIGYLPLEKFNIANIAPTEDDNYFRHRLIQGYVHDQGAAMFGGVQGHAGVFATADDVAAIFQMLLNKGVYKGKRYFETKTIEYFTAYNSHISRRALGFDKPDTDDDNGGPVGDRVTGYAFGHQGFTGTCAWADPSTGIVFVFLSNRVYPTADNNKINRLSVRTVAQDYIYEALGFPVNHQRVEVYRRQVKK
jgi:beta-glucosidase-like glycosyl hydrolase/CubicO group peptidase (beta-lactamase class C family)